MKYISQSGMRSKDSCQLSRLRGVAEETVVSCQSKTRKFVLFFILLLSAICYLLSAQFCHAELSDRVVAFIDDRAITLTELEENYKEMAKLKPEIKKEEVLNTMINRALLLREAKKLRIEAVGKDEIIKDYIELKLKTLIKITEEDLLQFYENNRKEFGNAAFEEIRDKIETYLVEAEVNVRLKKHIEELRARSYIKILQ